MKVTKTGAEYEEHFCLKQSLKDCLWETDSQPAGYFTDDDPDLIPIIPRFLCPFLSGFKAADSSGKAFCMKPATHPDLCRPSGAGRRRLHSAQVTLVKLSAVGPSMDFYSTLG